jgi:hypothetical protein
MKLRICFNIKIPSGLGLHALLRIKFNETEENYVQFCTNGESGLYVGIARG